jgi:hypothetical protein
VEPIPQCSCQTLAELVVGNVIFRERVEEWDHGDGVMGLGAALTARIGDESRYEAVGHANEVEVVRSAVEEVSHCGDALLVAATKPTFEGMGADIEVRNHES